MEQACFSPEPCEAEELRAEIRKTFKYSYTPRSNFTKEKTLKKLRLNETWPTDKCIGHVVLDIADYINRAKKLLEERENYKKIAID